MSIALPTTGYSAKVRLELLAGDDSFELAEIGPDSIYLRQPKHLSPCDAEVIMHVDDHERRWLVRLPDGIRPDAPLTRTVPRG